MAIQAWMLAASANAVMVVLYAAISFLIFRGIREGRQWRSNPVAVATAAVFATCTIGHGLHLLHVLPPFTILEPHEAEAAIAMFSDPRLIAWDAFTAVTAIGFFMLRSRLSVVYNGAAFCEDLQERERQARLIHDRVMRGIERAEERLRAGDREAGVLALAETLEESKTVITTLLGTVGTHTSLGPGDLRRDAASH